MSNRVVVIGSSRIDFTRDPSKLLKPDEIVIGIDVKRTIREKGVNQSIAAAKLGARTAFVSSLGSDVFGKECLTMLKANQVDTQHVKVRDNESGVITHITIAESGEQTILKFGGGQVSLSPDDVDAAQETIKNAAVLLTSFEMNPDIILHALKLYKGCGTSIVNGVDAVANSNPEILKTCDIFCVNKTVAELMTRLEPLTLENAQTALTILFEKGCNNVIITMGASGAVYATKYWQKLTHVPVESVTAVDTTGAGDAFLGALGFFIAYFPELRYKEKIRRACQIATQSVLKAGSQASYLTREQLPEELFVSKPEHVTSKRFKPM